MLVLSTGPRSLPGEGAALGPPLHGTPGEPATILVIEDDRSLRALLLDVLDGEGYRVVAASHSREAVQLARRRQPRAILLDPGQPGPPGGPCSSNSGLRIAPGTFP